MEGLGFGFLAELKRHHRETWQRRGGQDTELWCGGREGGGRQINGRVGRMSRGSPRKMEPVGRRMSQEQNIKGLGEDKAMEAELQMPWWFNSVNMIQEMELFTCALVLKRELGTDVLKASSVL